MEKSILRKGLIIGIIFLFIIINIVSTYASVVDDTVSSTIFNQKETKSIEKLTASQISNKEVPNLLCKIQVVWHRFKLIPTVHITPGQKVFNFTEQAGRVTANFTIVCETWSDPSIVVARLTGFQPNLYLTPSHPERSGLYYCLYQSGTEKFTITWDNYVIDTNGHNVTRIVWPGAGGILPLQYPWPNGWDITICPII